jgi:hypothetical protein
MIMHRWLAYALLITISLSLTACQMKKDESRPAPKRQTQQSNKKDKPELPPQFGSMEKTSLQLYRAGFKSWNEARAFSDQLETDWMRLKRELQKVESPQDKQAEAEMHLVAIDQSIDNQSQFELSEHANELIGVLQELSKKFKTVIPPEMIMAQTDLREIQLHIGREDWTMLQDLLKKAEGSWKKLTPKVKNVGAKGVSENLEGFFKELKTAVKEKNASKARSMVKLIDADLANLRTVMEKQSTQTSNQRSGSQ